MGTISFAGQNVDGVPVHQRARRGLVRAYQVPQLFPSFSAHGNVAVSAIARAQTHRRWWRPVRREDEIARNASAALDKLNIGHLTDRQAAVLGHGEKRELELATGFAAEPSLLLLDEPLAGRGPGARPQMIFFLGLQKKYAAVPRCVRFTWVKSDGYEGCPARARSASWLWECAGALWCGVARARGRGRRIAWAQWDGKEHIDSLHSRLHARDWRPCGSEWPRCHGLAKPSSRTCRHWLGAGGAPDLRVADGTREFDGVGPSGTSPGALEPRPDSFDVPPSERAGAQLRQSAVGRGATDAGHRPCVAHAAGTPGAG